MNGWLPQLLNAPRRRSFQRWLFVAGVLLLAWALMDARSPRAQAPPEAAFAPTTALLTVHLFDGATVPSLGAGGAAPSAAVFGQPAQLALFSAEGEHFVEQVRTSVEGGRWQGTVPVGDYWAVVHAEGRARVAQHVRVVEAPPSRPTLLELVLRPAHALTVSVVRTQGDELVPLPGATVLVEKPQGLPFGGKTDEKGRRRFAALPEGPWKVRVLAPGFEPYEAEVNADLLVRLRPVRTLRVTVLDGDRPVPAATVHIAGVSLWPARSVRTGPRGYVNVTGLKAGTYALYATEGDKASPVANAVELLPGEGRQDLSLQLERGDFVVARVITRDKEAIVGARVSFSSHGAGQFLQHGETDEHGMVRLGPFVKQEGVLQVRARGFVSRVVPARIPGPQEVELIRSGTVVGRVVDSDGFPVPGATVEVIGTDSFGMPVSVTHETRFIADNHFDWALSQNVLVPAGELGVLLGPVPPIPLGETREDVAVGRLVTNDKGRFEILEVPPGRLVVLARHPEHLDGKSEDFELQPGGRAEVEVVLGEGRLLRGRVLDHRDFPVADARVRLSAPGFERVVAVDPDGTFRVPSAPDELTLRVTRASRPLLVLYERRVQGAERDEEVPLTLPEPREPSRIRLVDAQGEPVALGQVSLSSRVAEVPLRSTRFSSEQGWVEFDETRGLSVELAIQAPGFVRQKVERTLGDEQTLRLTRALEARGRITGVRGRLPAAGAQVTLRSGSVFERTTADEVGEYVFSNVPPGSATIRAKHSEYGKAEREVVVRAGVAGRPAELPDIDLQPAAIITGRVVDQRGFPVPGALVAPEPLSAYLSDQGPGGHELSDERGEFRLEVLRERGAPLRLYAAWPSHGVGTTRDVEFDGRGDAQDVEIVIDELDQAPAGELGTVLVSLVEERNRVVVFAVARPSSPFAQEVRKDDQLVAVDGYGFADLDEARELLSGVPGTDVVLTVRRGARELDIRVVREAFRRANR